MAKLYFCPPNFHKLTILTLKFSKWHLCPSLLVPFAKVTTSIDFDRMNAGVGVKIVGLYKLGANIAG